VVGFVDRRILPARVIGTDPSTDVALLKVEGSSFPTIPLGNDEAVQVGDQVLAVGNPLGLTFTVTSGIISAKGRSGSLTGLFESNYAVVDFIQTDAAINPGNSGGPLVDMQGRAIGINSAIASPTGVYAGYGFAIPISIARIVMDELRAHGRVRRAILGVSIQDVGPADAQAAGLREIRGVLVGGFTGTNSPARQAGLQLGDVITAINNRAVDRVSDLQRTIFGFQPGQRVSVTVQRFGTQRNFDITLGEAPREQVATGDVARPGAPSSGGQLGIAVEPLTPELARRLQVPNEISGLIVAQVSPSGPASGRLAEGDIITAVITSGRQRPIRSVEELRTELTRAGAVVVSLVVYSPQARGTRVVNIPLTR
jgi:serine protease Do